MLSLRDNEVVKAILQKDIERTHEIQTIKLEKALGKEVLMEIEQQKSEKPSFGMVLNKHLLK